MGLWRETSNPLTRRLLPWDCPQRRARFPTSYEDSFGVWWKKRRLIGRSSMQEASGRLVSKCCRICLLALLPERRFWTKAPATPASQLELVTEGPWCVWVDQGVELEAAMYAAATLRRTVAANTRTLLLVVPSSDSRFYNVRHILQWPWHQILPGPGEERVIFYRGRFGRSRLPWRRYSRFACDDIHSSLLLRQLF